MSFIRPEATATLWRWREVLVGAALAVLALWWLAGPQGLLGMIAPVLLVGAGALITENKVIPDGSLVMGAPGKVVRELDAAAIQGLTLSAEHYQQNAARFGRDLKVI